MDNKLTFKKHIESLVISCTKDIAIVKSLSCGVKGCHPRYLLQVYNSLIRAKMDYGCALYGHASKKLLNKLETIQNQVIRIILGAFCTTPIIAMQSEAYIVPLNIRREVLTNNLIYKILIKDDHPTYRNLMLLNFIKENNKFWSKRKIPLFLQSVDEALRVNPNLMINKGFQRILTGHYFSMKLISVSVPQLKS